MNNGRRVELDVTYNNAPFAGQVGAEIESLTYVDNAADDSDSIDITLDAQDSKWLHGWLPEEGATLRPRIIGRDWNGPGDTHVMECGLFILDDVAYQDAPTTLQVGGVSKPSDTDFSELERETIWKNTSIKRIGESIAGRYGLGFTYDADDYDIECDEQDGTDSSYYNTLCKNYGLILKVYAKRLWVYDRERYKGKRAVQDFDRTNIMEQRKFLAMVGPLAQADMQKSGILASLTIAQAILESGWGASELATKANALFGIKADARWSGKAYSKDTKECYDGATYTTITALFRAYDSWAESVADHSAFLLANKRYAAVVGERDYKVACKAIKAAGYATDPGYPQKLIGLIEKYGLTVYDGKAEQEDKTSMNISITKKTSTHNTTAAAGRAIRYIVVHYTAGVTSKPGSAAGTASYFGSTSKQVSADFIVDDGGAVQYNGDIRNRYTWHCGGGKYNTKGGAYYGKATNRNTIGIEVCSTNDTGKMTVANDSHWRFTDKVVSNLVELVKYLMEEYGIDAAHVIRHYDVNGKPCPGIIGWNEDTGSAAKWAAFKARLGAATPGGQTGGSTNTGTATGNTALTYKVGDIVQFAGGKHYANAQAASGTTVKPGQAKVTAVATAGKHPYHLVHTDSTSTVYGWVDAAAITGKASATPAAKTYTVKAGDSLWRIAAQQLGNGARYKEIKTLNGLKNNTIHAGQVLKLPN